MKTMLLKRVSFYFRSRQALWSNYYLLVLKMIRQEIAFAKYKDTSTKNLVLQLAEIKHDNRKLLARCTRAENKLASLHVVDKNNDRAKH